MATNTVPVVEVNDFHMEVFPFWDNYLTSLGIQPVYFLPLNKLNAKKEGTFGGIYEKIIDRQHIHDISKLAYLKRCETLVINSYVDKKSENRPLYDWLIKHFHLHFKRLVMIFHGKSPSIINLPDVQEVVGKFNSFVPIFLHPSVSAIKTKPTVSICLPIYNYILPPPKFHQGKIRVGIIGTLWRDCRNYDMLIDDLAKHPCHFLEVVLIGGTVPRGNTKGIIESRARQCGVFNQINFQLNLPTKAFLEEIEKLHFICPLVKATDYLTNILSGCVPLAISLNIPLIMRGALAKAYHIHSQVQYTHHFSEVIPILKNLTPSHYNVLKKSLRNTYSRFHKNNQNEFLRIFRSSSS